MKCTKCKVGEVVFDNDVIRLDNKERVIFHHQIGHCNNCGMTYDKDVLPRKRSRNASSLSIGAIILTIIPIIPFVGLILAIVDIVKKDQRFSHYLSYIAIVINIAITIMYLIAIISYFNKYMVDTSIVL